MIGLGGVRGRDAWGEAQRRDAEAMSGQECACQRASDLWDVRTAWARTLAGDPLALQSEQRTTSLCIPVIVQNPERVHLGLRWKEFSGIPRTEDAGPDHHQPSPSPPPPPSQKEPEGGLKAGPVLQPQNAISLVFLPRTLL